MVAGGVIGLSALAWTYHFDPSRSRLFLPCLFHTVTGMWCPGCGATRALHALLHGQVEVAWGFNALFVVALLLAPPIALVARLRPGVAAGLRHPLALAALVALLITFGVLRNLPLAPFSSLAP